MSNKYRYNKRPPKNRKRHVVIVIIICLVVVVGLLSIAVYLIGRVNNQKGPVSGPTVTLGSVSSSSADNTVLISEPDYQFKLPNSWREISSVNNDNQDSITWQSFAKDATNRFLTIYTDPIPTTFPVNRELPIEVHGSQLGYGMISDNCANFTTPSPTKPIIPVLAKWENVSFYCDLPNPIDNKVGTGTIGSVNSISITGAKSGTKHYFFLYIDRNNAPDYTILYSVINSFEAK